MEKIIDKLREVFRLHAIAFLVLASIMFIGLDNGSKLFLWIGIALAIAMAAVDIIFNLIVKDRPKGGQGWKDGKQSM